MSRAVGRYGRTQTVTGTRDDLGPMRIRFSARAGGVAAGSPSDQTRKPSRRPNKASTSPDAVPRAR